MNHGLAIALALLAGHATAVGSTAHDGRWGVVLSCPDIRDHTGLVKGYQYALEAVVANGQLRGQYGEAGRPNSLSLLGTVGESGELEVKANGNVGAASDAAGKAQRGTPYAYTLRGQLAGNSGQAERRETRACTAAFTKKL